MHHNHDDTERVNRRESLYHLAADSRPLLIVFVVLYVQIGLPSGVCSQNEAAEKADGPVEARAFDEFSVEFRGIWMWWEKARFAVKGDGAVEFSMSKAPNNDARYTAKFRLSPKHLDQLAQLLKETNWLTKPGANEQPGYTDATRIDMKLVRGGKGKRRGVTIATPSRIFPWCVSSNGSTGRSSY